MADTRVRTNLTIAPKVRDRMARHKDANWSRIAEAAFKEYMQGRKLNGAEYVKELEREVKRLRAVIAKVQRTVKEVK